MKRKKVFVKSPMVLRLLAISAIIAILMPTGAVFAANATAPLSTVTNPVFGTPGGTVPSTPPPNLAPYIQDINAAIQLGKALFWDMQAGSDGVQACATCHYRAGVDPIKHPEDADSVRDQNELAPGFDNVFTLATPNVPLGNGAGQVPIGNDKFTLARIASPFPNPLPAGSGTDDVIGSQGVHKTKFSGVAAGSRKDQGTPLVDTVFTSGGVNVRQVTGRNTPPTINAVFNYDNFWDGRASNLFNGNNPIGPMDTKQAGIWLNAGTQGITSLVNQTVAVPNASLASQAVGPPLSDVEMSFAGRTFPELGRKMLSLTPLGTQTVSANDSVLGPLSNGRGLNVTNPATGDTGYKAMIQKAFVPQLWNATQNTPTGFTQMEANFSFFWGMAIMCYEATLVSDQTPFDISLGGGPALPTVVSVTGFISGSPNPATGNAVAGLGDFNGKCAICHSGNEMTTASVANILGNSVTTVVISGTTFTVPANSVDTTNGFARTAGVTDTGFANIGVRPTTEDNGRGAASPNFPFPLSLAVQKATGNIPPGTNPTTQVVAGGAATQVNASFKVPSIRNVELSGPYFHNGSAERLGDVVDLYANGGNFDNPERATSVQGAAAGGTKNDLVAFMLQLTDPRVKAESAPFDHPELIIPNGEPEFGHMRRISAKDSAGAVALSAPIIAATAPATHNSTKLTISGAMEAGSTVTIAINGGAAFTPDTVGDTTWSTALTGLKAGANTIAVTANPIAPVPTGVVTTLSLAPNVTFPSGIVTGGPTVAVTDALRILRIALGVIPQTTNDLTNGDVAPLVNGLPAPDGKIDIADALVGLRKAVGLENF